MNGLYLVLRSFADMTVDRARAVGRAFDAHPLLRPVKVGGDPARIGVGASLEALIAKQGLPVDWLTVRHDGTWPDFESGEIQLLPDRGGWTGMQKNGEWEYLLGGHQITQHWLATTMAEAGAVAAAAGLFEDLAVAMDAAYGYVVPESLMPPSMHSAILRQLPGVFWLNYFGPAFASRCPGLSRVTGACAVATGGVLVRTTDDPWQPPVQGVPEWQLELRTLFGEQAFLSQQPNPSLPAVEDHLAASPGTPEMPWEAWQRQKASGDRIKKYASARKRLARAQDRRAEPMLAADLVEWSTSFDLADWQDFAKYLARKLRGDLSTALGKAMLSVISTAPLDDEDDIVLDTSLGPIRLGWFIADTETVDVFIHGSPGVTTLCQAWFD
jgi:hypothetical protein